MKRPVRSRCPVCASFGIERLTDRHSGPWFEVVHTKRTVELRGYACRAHTLEFAPIPFEWPNDERGLKLLYGESR